MTGPEIVNLIADLIARLGFPIAVSAFLLWERRTTLKELTATMADLRDAIEVMTTRLLSHRPPRG